MRQLRTSDAPEDAGAADAGDAEHERGDPQREALARGQFVDLVEGGDEAGLLLAADLVESPAEVLEVLDPLEVADDHAPRVGQDVGDDGDPALVEDLVGLGPG